MSYFHEIICAILLTTTLIEGHRQGSNCMLKDTRMAGVCVPFANCQSAKEAAFEGTLPQRCDLTDNKSQLVCCTKAGCPPLPKGLVTQLPAGSRAADYCIELAEKIHPCQETHFGWIRGNICPLLTQDSNTVYHSTPLTTAAEAPYYGRIGSDQGGNILWRGYPATLVSDRWVLCTARAVDGVGVNTKKFVGLGGTFSPRYNPDEIYGVTKQHIHPQFNRPYSEVYYDIALLQLDREVTFTRRILPACLHTGTPLPNNGFIFTAWAGTPDFFDYKTTMQLVTQEECSRAFPNRRYYFPDGVKHDLQMCSRTANTTGNCLDWQNGAPLTVSNSPRVACTRLLVGLTTWWNTSPCTHIYTRISAYIPWIEGIVWPTSGVVV